MVSHEFTGSAIRRSLFCRVLIHNERMQEPLNTCRTCGCTVEQSALACKNCDSVFQPKTKEAPPRLELIPPQEPNQQMCRQCGFVADSIVTVCPKCREVFGRAKASKPELKVVKRKAKLPVLELEEMVCVEPEFKRLVLAMVIIISIIIALALTHR